MKNLFLLGFCSLVAILYCNSGYSQTSEILPGDLTLLRYGDRITVQSNVESYTWTLTVTGGKDKATDSTVYYVDCLGQTKSPVSKSKLAATIKQTVEQTGVGVIFVGLVKRIACIVYMDVCEHYSLKVEDTIGCDEINY